MDLVRSEIPEEHETKETMWIYKDNKQLFNKYSQIETQEQVIIISPKIEEKEPEIKITTTSITTPTPTPTQVPIINNKLKKNTPLELIIRYTESNDKMKREIKDKLIELITIPEFSKAFGMKKSSEIVSAITRDSWNQSIALFISFLLDSSIVYKEKPYIYNKDKVTKEIVVI